ncbi:MAG: AAA family ATPase [Lachnospiraceae bacterium]|nr:AAA family ATPase [Lachnospiraceae bacterium]
MILQQLHIDGFGKLANLDLTFSEDLNLICGDNEAGKSTLCSFIFHMLYGLERSRGRASRFDAYVHFLPWHATAYGGTLTFTANGASWFLERSFLSDTRFTRLTRLDDGVVMPHGETMLAQLLSQVNGAAYRAMFHISGQSNSDINALSGILRQYTQNLPGSGSMTFSASQALQNLKRQKKEALAELSGATSGDLFCVTEELHALQTKLHEQAGFDDILVQEAPPQHATLYHFGIVVTAISFLFLLLGVYFLFCPPFSKSTSLSIDYLPAALSFLAGLFGMLFMIRKKSSLDCVTDFDEVHSLSAEKDEYSLNKSLSHSLDELQSLLGRIDILNAKKLLLEKQLLSDESLSQKIDALQLAIDTISDLSSEIHHTYSPDLQRTFIRHASALTGRLFSQLLIDESFHFSLIEEGRLIPIDGLSRGTVEQLMFACRLASMELLFPGAELPLLLDDIFSTTDDSRLAVLLARLSADYPGQKLIFSCQKREAAILSQHSLPYHLIQL